MAKTMERLVEAVRSIFTGWKRTSPRPEQAALLQPLQPLDDVLGPLATPLAMLDAKGAVVYQNPAWEQWTRECGLPRFAKLGERPTFADIWRLAHVQAIPGISDLLEGVAHVLSGERVQTAHEICVQAPGGTRWLILEACRPTTGGGAVLCLRDVSEARRLEISLRRTEAQLRQAQKIEALGRLAGGVAHDFNNLITIITSCCDLLLKGPPVAQPARDLVGEIRRAAERASLLARRLVASSRPQPPSPAILDLNLLLTHVTRMMRGLIGENIELITSLEHDVGSVQIDAAQMEQVIINLVLNARDAMPQGGKLTLATHHVQLDETHRERHPGVEPGFYVLLTVSDTGCGMKQEVKNRLFEPYFTTKEAGKGTGLGLSIVRGIIRQHAGYLEVASEPGQGSTFLVYLPEVKVPVTQDAGPVEVAESPRGTESVLVVEDVEAVRRAVRQLLQLSGYHVVEAVSGMEAIAKMDAHACPVDLLLTDLVLPQMNGLQIAQALRLKNPKLKVLYITGYEDDDLLHGNVSQVQMDVLRKPFGPDELARRVRLALDDPAVPAPKSLGFGSPHGQTLANGSRIQES